MPNNIFILGIESSCDETALAVLKSNGINTPPDIISEVLFSQIQEHAPYGGVVPELAARAHAHRMPSLLQQVMHQAGIGFKDLSAVAATSEPGLIGGVIVGLMTAKGICVAAKKPLIAINHLEGHALSPMLTENITFPYLLLLVSGGHCQIILVHDLGQYEQIGTTIDDAVGEAFDKIAKLLNLGFPGGPAVEKMAVNGDMNRFSLPRPLCRDMIPNFSFSGLKTAVIRIVESGDIKTEQDIADLCASFQKAVSECLVNRLSIAMDIFNKHISDKNKRFIVAGGVAANQFIRSYLKDLCEEKGFSFHAPPLQYCTDNAVMIAYAGLKRFEKKLFSSLDVKPLARAPLGQGGD